MRIFNGIPAASFVAVEISQLIYLDVIRMDKITCFIYLIFTLFTKFLEIINTEQSDGKNMRVVACAKL